MLIQRVILTAAAITLILTSQAQATPVTIDFESLAQNNGGLHNQGTSYSEDGFTLQSPRLTTFGTLDFRFTGSTAMFDNRRDGTTTLTQTNGNPFDLTSIDLAELNGSRVAMVNFTGNLSGGGTVMQAFTLDGSAFGAETFNFSPAFTNLSSVTWRQASPYHQYDNIVVDGAPNSAVPEPSTMLLFGSGLAGLIGWRHRRTMQK